MTDSCELSYQESTEKLMARFRDVKAIVKKKALRILNNIVLVNRVFQFCYLFGLGGIAGTGIVVAIPYLYTNYDESITWYIRGFGYFLVFQLMTNWLCMRFVDCSYNPFLHGAMPNGVVLGQNVSQLREQEEINYYEQNSNRPRKDASVVSINNGSVMYVATEIPTSENSPPARTEFPYFSWTPCIRCNRPRPPRCHHCPICNKCILKRDHHCFIAGVCVGYRNLRHFIVFLVWALVATFFALLHALVYAYYDVFPHVRYIDVIFPFAIIRAALGFIEWTYVLLIILGWICLAYFGWSLDFLKKVKLLVQEGKTSFEHEFKMDVRDTRNFTGKLRSVFGNYWMLNFIVPLHFVFEPIDDPVSWPNIKA